jgi:hypothetical protein
MRLFALLVLVLLAAGCGGGRVADESKQAATIAQKPSVHVRCTSVSGGFRACTTFLGTGERSRIERKDAAQWTVFLEYGQAPKPGHGWWRRVVASPDGEALLGQWSGECEIQSTHVVSTADETVRPILEGQPSTAVGWASDGRARVHLVGDFWAVKAKRLVKAGIYRVDPATLAFELERRIPTKPVC